MDTFAEELLSVLVAGRESGFDQHLREFVSRFARALGGLDYRLFVRQGRTQFLALSRPQIAMRGFACGQMYTMVLADYDGTALMANSAFWARVENPSVLPLILTCDERSYRLGLDRVGNWFALVLSPSEIVRILTAKNGLAQFKDIVRHRFPVSVLHPFDPHHPVTEHAFFGRHQFLKLLRDNPMTSYALVGPSKMGKTSLGKQHLTPSRDERVSHARQAYCDLYEVVPSERLLTRAICMAIEPGAHAFYEDPEHLPQFLAKSRARLGMPLEIILDEADRHCRLKTMRRLLHLSEKGLCRLILVGRWGLMKAAAHTKDENMSRLEPMILEPLGMEEAVALIERPLADLGLDVAPHLHGLRWAINQCGRVPGHLQEFGACLIEELEPSSGDLTPEDIRRALERVLTASRLCGLLDDLSGPKARAGALALALHRNGGAEFDALRLREMLVDLHLPLPMRECMEICDELMVHHLVGYKAGVYHICRWDFAAEGRRERRLYEAMLADEIREALGEAEQF